MKESWCWTAILIRIFVLAVLSKRKTYFEICSKSNIPSNQTWVKYCGIHLVWVEKGTSTCCYKFNVLTRKHKEIMIFKMDNIIYYIFLVWNITSLQHKLPHSPNGFVRKNPICLFWDHKNKLIDILNGNGNSFGASNRGEARGEEKTGNTVLWSVQKCASKEGGG